MNITVETKQFSANRDGKLAGRIVHLDQERDNRQVLLSFANSIQERDIVTYEHSRRVATYAQRLARYLGWSRRDAPDLALAGLVHDLRQTWIANGIALEAHVPSPTV